MFHTHCNSYRRLNLSIWVHIYYVHAGVKGLDRVRSLVSGVIDSKDVGVQVSQSHSVFAITVKALFCCKNIA